MLMAVHAPLPGVSLAEMNAVGLMMAAAASGQRSQAMERRVAHWRAKEEIRNGTRPAGG